MESETKQSRKEKKHAEKKLIHEKYSKLFNETLSSIWQQNTDTDYILHVGKTNSGKTYNAIRRLKEVGNGLYLAPLRLLAWEVYEKLNSDGYSCSLVTGEEEITVPGAQIISSTIEMANYGVRYNVVVIDEAFMIGDRDRGKSWLNAILTINAREVHIILNEEALVLISEILDLTDRGYMVKPYEMLQKFRFSDNPFVFSKNIPKRGVFVTFSRVNVLINKLKLENLGFRVSVLYGNLPPEVKKHQIELFINGETDFLVSTDVIGMGINVPCDYIVFLDIEKFDGIQNRYLTSTEVKQIAGRTGRYNISSDKSFVSATSVKALSYLQKRYSEKILLKKACLGITYEMFQSFGETMRISDRLMFFKEIDFIPSRLKHVIEKESISKYMDICHIIQEKNFDLRTQWHFLTAPIKLNNKTYFNNQVSRYKKKGFIEPPFVQVHYSDAKELEGVISEIELYICLSRNLEHDRAQKEIIIKEKEQLINRLTEILMDRKLAAKKKCKLCTASLDITNPHNYCEDCYENKVRGWGYNSWY